VRFLVLALAAVAAFPYLPGAKSPAFQGVSLFLGVLLSLGSSSAIGNVIAGIAMTYMRPFAIGDRVKIGETVGDVIETGPLVIRIRTIKNEEITVANAIVLGEHIVNYSACARQQGLILHTGVTIGYDAPWRQVQQLLISAARATEGVLTEPAPFVLQTALDDFYVSYQINAYTAQASQMAVLYSRLHAQIQDHFNAAGVEIMSSHYLNLRDGNPVTIPAASRPKDYQAPPFRVAEVSKAPGKT
jgi:small-conductance mechanosensitive channel